MIDTLNNEVTFREIDDLYKEAESLRERDFVAAIDLAFRAKEFSEKISYSKGINYYLIFSGFEQYLNNNFEEASEIYNRAIEYFESEQDESTLALLYQLLAFSKMRGSQHTDAIFLLEKALKIRIKFKDNFNIARIYNNLAVIWSDLADFTKSFDYFKKSLDLFIEIDNKPFILKVKDNLANTYKKTDNFKEALKLRGYIYENLNELETEREKLFVIVNYASDYSHIDDLENSIKYFEQAIEMCIKLSDDNTLAKCYQNMGTIEIKKNNLATAIDYFENAKEIFKSQNDIYNYIIVLNSIANTKIELGSNEEAIEIFKNIIKLASEVGFKVYESISYNQLSDVYKSIGDYKSAYECYVKYSELDKIIFNENVASKISDLQSVYELNALRKESEFEKRKNIELSDINKQLEENNATLNDLLIEKSEILSIASHDLRSPLSNIIGLSKFLREEIKDKITEENLEDFDNIIHSSNQMMNIIENILTEETFNKGSMIFNFTEFDLRNIITEVIAAHSLSANNKNIKIKYTSTPKFININTDPFILKQIIDNLLSNAIKFSNADKNVYVMATKKESIIRITVKDEGPGLTSDDMKNLFKKYSKLSAKPTAGEPSTGLGLSIVKKYVEALGGSIRCESESGYGAEFIITFNSI